MGVLRLVILVCGLSALLAPGAVRGQTAPDPEALLADVEVTTGAMDPGVALETAIDPADPLTAERNIARPRPPNGPFRPEAQQISDLAPGSSLRPVMRDSWAVPAAHWDDHPRGPAWTAAVLAALRGPGAPLLDVVPDDIRAWCPGYIQASPEQRAAFWTGLVSTLAWHESTHRPRAVGGGGQWFGLVQIAPGTARWRDCDVRSAEALMDGPSNLRCAMRIMAITVPRDQVVSAGMQGVAADWGPFHSARKREEMRTWMRDQDYCQAPPPAMRPVMRPGGMAGLNANGAPAQEAPVSRARPVPRPRQI